MTSTSRCIPTPCVAPIVKGLREGIIRGTCFLLRGRRARNAPVIVKLAVVVDKVWIRRRRGFRFLFLYSIYVCVRVRVRVKKSHILRERKKVEKFLKKFEKIRKKCLTLFFANGIMFRLSIKRTLFRRVSFCRKRKNED